MKHKVGFMGLGIMGAALAQMWPRQATRSLYITGRL